MQYELAYATIGDKFAEWVSAIGGLVDLDPTSTSNKPRNIRSAMSYAQSNGFRLVTTDTIDGSLYLFFERTREA